MNLQEEKLQKVKKSCHVTKKILGAIRILFVVCAIMCIVGASICVVMRDSINESIPAQIENGNVTIDVNDISLGDGLIDAEIETEQLIAEGQYALTFALYCGFGAVVCIFMAVIFHLIRSIFCAIEESENPFTDEILHKIKVIFIIVTVLAFLEAGIGNGVFVWLTLWCVYCIFGYGHALQIEVDETL